MCRPWNSFGSGVIISTAFIHLLAPSWEALTSPCLTGTWTLYPWTPAITMASVFGIFLIELTAHRAGSKYLRRRGLRTHDAHLAAGNRSAHTTHGLHSQPIRGEDGGLIDERVKTGAAATDDPEATGVTSSHDHDHDHEYKLDDNALAQILGVCLLEFGVIFHVGRGTTTRCRNATDLFSFSQSFVIGLTLAVDEDFVTLFVVLVFHRACLECASS